MSDQRYEKSRGCIEEEEYWTEILAFVKWMCLHLTTWHCFGARWERCWIRVLSWGCGCGVGVCVWVWVWVCVWVASSAPHPHSRLHHSHLHTPTVPLPNMVAGEGPTLTKVHSSVRVRTRDAHSPGPNVGAATALTMVHHLLRVRARDKHSRGTTAGEATTLTMGHRLVRVRTWEEHSPGTNAGEAAIHWSKNPVNNQLWAFRNVFNNPQKLYDTDINPKRIFHNKGPWYWAYIKTERISELYSWTQWSIFQ